MEILDSGIDAHCKTNVAVIYYVLDRNINLTNLASVGHYQMVISIQIATYVNKDMMATSLAQTLTSSGF